MNITLPPWKPGYESSITKEAYDKVLGEAQPLLDRAIEIYEAYLRTGNGVLYDVFDDVVSKLHSKLGILSQVAWTEVNKAAMAMEYAAELNVFNNGLPYKPTMLWDLAGALR